MFLVNQNKKSTNFLPFKKSKKKLKQVRDYNNK